MNIAICDDDLLFLENLEALLLQFCEKQEIPAQIYCCRSAGEFLKSAMEQFDLVFMDVRLGEESGIHAARIFRRRNEQAVLIFVSSYLSYATRGYEVNAFRYILKDSLEGEFPFAMQAALARLHARAQTISFRTVEGESLTLRLSDIWYLESSNHNVLIHAGAGQYRVYDSLARLTARIPSDDFLQIQRSYYVNMRNVSEVKNNTVIFPDGRSLSGSRGSRELLRQKFLAIQGEC